MSNTDSNSSDSRSSPSYLKWSKSLTSLLDSPDGRDLFEEYLRGEGKQCVEQLQFLWAVAGLKVMQSTEDKIQKMIQIIYTTYIPILFGVSDSTRAALEENIKNPDINIFDTALAEVTEHMRGSLYPNFLKSDNYLRAVASYYEEGQGHEHVESTSEQSQPSTVSVPQAPDSGCSSTVGMFDQPESETSKIHDLQTVHEEEEMLSFNKPPPGPVRKLTRELLLSSQVDRAATTTKKFIGGVPLNPYHAHANYNSYNPVSRQDSETQSISTEESLDLRSRSRHPASHHRTRPHISSRRPVIPMQNDTLQPVGRPGPPLTQINPKPESALAEKNPKAFAEKLIEKLEKLFEERNPGAHGIVQAALKLQQGIEEPEQDILDQHVSRVWADKTPTSCSPNVESADISRRRRIPIATASWFKNNASVDSGLNSDRDYRDRLPRTHKGKPIVPSRSKTQDIDSGISMLTLSQVSVGSTESSGSSKAGRGNGNSERRGIPKPEPGPSSSRIRQGAPAVKRHSPPSDGRKLKEYLRL